MYLINSNAIHVGLCMYLIDLKAISISCLRVVFDRFISHFMCPFLRIGPCVYLAYLKAICLSYCLCKGLCIYSIDLKKKNHASFCFHRGICMYVSDSFKRHACLLASV